MYELRRCVSVLAVLASTSLLVVTAAPDEAEALNLVDDEELELNLTGVTNGTYAIETTRTSAEGEGADASNDEGGDTSVRYGPSVSLARLKLSGRYDDVGDIAIQVGGASGNLQLLDAVASLDLGSPFHVRLGKFKPTVSPQFLIGAPNVYTSNRALLNDFVPGRHTGVATGVKKGFGGTKVKAEIGLFQPTRGSFENPRGQLFTGRVLVGLPMGLDFHLGYAGHVLDDHSYTVLEEVKTGPNSGSSGEGAGSNGGGNVDPTRNNNGSNGGNNGNAKEDNTELRPVPRPVVQYNSPVDAAIIYDDERTYAHLEGVAVLDGPTDETVYGVHALGAYIIGPTDGIHFEATGAYDVADAASTRHRVSVGGNTYFYDTGIEVETHYELTFVDGTDQTIHGVFLALQTVI